jgi:hypothetical protein
MGFDSTIRSNVWVVASEALGFHVRRTHDMNLRVWSPVPRRAPDEQDNPTCNQEIPARLADRHRVLLSVSDIAEVRRAS